MFIPSYQDAVEIWVELLHKVCFKKPKRTEAEELIHNTLLFEVRKHRLMKKGIRRIEATRQALVEQLTKEE